MSFRPFAEPVSSESQEEFARILESWSEARRTGEGGQPEEIRWIQWWFDPEHGSGVAHFEAEGESRTQSGVLAVTLRDGRIERRDEFRWQGTWQLSPGAAATASEDVQKTLTSARVAVVRRDGGTLASLLTDDYLCVYPDGRVLNREERIRMAVNASQTIVHVAQMESLDLRIRIHGETALVTERIRQVGLRAGVLRVDQWIATTVLRRIGQVWKLANSQLTPVQTAL